MRVVCKECGHRARISHSVSLTDDPGGVRDLYCQCLDVECSHSFVMTLSFSRTINTPAMTGKQLLLQRLIKLSAEERRNLFNQVESIN